MKALSLKFLLKSKLFILSVFLFAFWWIWNYGLDAYNLYTGKTPMFSVTAEIKVRDETVRIERQVPCLAIAHGELLPYLLEPWKLSRRPYQYHARDMSTGAYLKDGSAVMVTIPSVCQKIRKNRKKNMEKAELLPEGFMPMVALVDDPGDPQVVKLIASRSYYQRPDSEVELLSYEIKPMEPGNFPDLMDEFNWMRGTHTAEAEIGFRKRLYFRNEYLTGMPVEMFRAGQPSDVPIDDLTKPTFLYDLPDFKYPSDPTGKNQYGIEFPGIRSFGLFAFPFFSVNFESEPYARQLSYDHVIPIYREDGKKTYDPEQRGYLLLYRQQNGDQGAEEILEWDQDKRNVISRTRVQRNTLTRNGTTFDLVNESISKRSKMRRIKASYFYDPETHKVYALSSRLITFPDI